MKTFQQLIVGLIAAILSAISILPTTQAADIPIEIYIVGGIDLVLTGDWANGLTFNQVTRIAGYEQNETSIWEGVAANDYISFSDDTTTAGFYITISATDYAYSGSSQTQGSLPASNSKIVGKIISGNPTAVDEGLDDPTKNLSILHNSCSQADTSKFDFNSDFSSQTAGYSLALSNSEQTLITSTADCLAIGHVRFDRIQINIPQSAANGSYLSNWTLTIFDGQP